MTEAEWKVATDPKKMLQFLLGKARDRKIRLYACACCRRIWSLLTDNRSREVIEVAEKYADGQVNKLALVDASRAAYRAGITLYRRGEEVITRWAAHAAQASAYLNHLRLAEACLVRTMYVIEQFGIRKPAEENIEQVKLVFEVFHNPFTTVTVETTWLTSTVTAIARQMYDSRDFSAMPILADALQDAGCDNDEILNHCRRPADHVRGCWVVDLLLNLE
jgi:hypothetical protein